MIYTSIEKILDQYRANIARKTINRQEVEELLAFVLGKPREYIHTYPKQVLSPWQYLKVKYLVKKIENNTPLAYLLSEKYFYALKFHVNKHVLVPRPETEVLVDLLIELLRNKLSSNKPLSYVDIGTGTGCIPISVSHELKKEGLLSDIYVSAIDISAKALAVAKKNSKTHNLDKKITFYQGNLLEPTLKNSSIIKSDSEIIISANLPYLKKEQILASPSIQNEPRLALDGGQDGMESYIELFKQAKELTRLKSPKSITIFCEIDHTQVDVFKDELLKNLPEFKYELIKDLGGYDRVVKISFS